MPRDLHFIPITVLLLCLGLGCRPEPPAGPFTLKVVLKAQQAERIRLFYHDAGGSSYRAAQYVERKLPGGGIWDTLAFPIPPAASLSHLRLDLGEDGHTGLLEMRSLEVTGERVLWKADSSQIHRLWVPNIYAVHDGGTGYQRQVVDGRYDPFLQASPLLNRFLEMRLGMGLLQEYTAQQP